MAIGKGNSLQENRNITSFVDFDTTGKTFKPNVSGKPLAHKFDLSIHPNRIPLDFTEDTGDGVRIKLGDVVHVDLEVPVEAVVTSIIKRKHTGKIFITGTLRDESVQSWPSTIVRFGPIEKPKTKGPKGSENWDMYQWEKYYQGEPVDPYKDFEFDFFLENGFMTEQEVRELKEEMKKDKTLLDNSVKPHKGTIRTWRVGDKLKNGGTVIDFGRTLKKPFGVMVNYGEPVRGGAIGDLIENMWQHIPPLNLKVAPGRTKSWRIGSHAQFGHGKDAALWEVLYFVVGDKKNLHAVLGRGQQLKLVPVSELHKHRLERPLKTFKENKSGVPLAHHFDVVEPNQKAKVEKTLIEKKIIEKKVDPIVKHDVHWVNHPKNSAPELEPDHELSCQYHHGRKLMQEANWKDWYKGTEDWKTYREATPEARQQLRVPPFRDPSQFPIKSFFEVDERTGRNRYGLKPTVVTATRISKQKQS